MRKLLFVPLLLLVALAGCDTSNTNPGGHTPEEIANAKPKPVAPAAPKAAQQSAGSTDGAELYGQYCAVCHNQGKNGPPLEGIMGRREFPSGTPANDARLKDTIKMGRAMMPAFTNTLTDEQINAIVKYVHTL
jgi:mono/diheme cytochrome c family protein